ncbi:hypothetical protein ACH4OW_07010 [Streptomyces sp. NPDC017056]|uniref:hypothetical protein n=1 Tax=Streptomyces sp. NPDC017056 TaxID=3364973 RepID=UPI00379F9C80
MVRGLGRSLGRTTRGGFAGRLASVLVPVQLTVLVGAAAAWAAPPGPSVGSSGPTAGLPGDLPAYRTAAGAQAVRGTPAPANAPRIGPGTYTDTLASGDEKFYAVRLDGKSSAYFSAVAAPRPGTEVADHTDSLKVVLQDADGSTCAPGGSTSFRGRSMAYPIADYATRRIDGPRTNCQQAGTYYLVVKRVGRAKTGATARWPVELRVQREPGLTGTPPAQPGPGTWSTATPVPLSGGTTKEARGGTGFNDAGAVGKGVWRDRIKPGETRFYRVPLDWGQQLSVSAELPQAALSGSGTKSAGRGVAGSRLVASALGLGVYNPARGPVSDTRFVPYDGKPAAAKFLTAPVDYGNRYNATAPVNAMRFAGSYYLAVSLHPDAAKYFEDGAQFTLRVDPLGRPQRAPGYREDAAEFSVTPQERTAADTGPRPQQDEHNGALRLVGYAGISTGTVLLLVMGVWTVMARRGGGRSAEPGGPDGRPVS